MSREAKIREAIRAMIRNMIPVTNRKVVVKEVREPEGLMDCESDNGVAYLDILLSLNGDQGMIIIPEVGSQVIISMVENSGTYGYLVLADKVEAITLKISQGFTVRLDKSGIGTINGDNFGGLTITPELLKKINALEDEINTVKNLLNGWVPTPLDGGAALKGAVTSWAAQPIIKTTLSEIENDKVKHGG